MEARHYVYELRRTSPGPGATRYIGVRTAKNGEPEQDEYWGSSRKVISEIKRGRNFEKTIIRTFTSRADAEFFEAELQWQHMAGKNPNFYNEFSQLIDGKVDQLFPRQRFVSAWGEHRWFVVGSEPEGWELDPAIWAQFEDMSHKDAFSSCWRYTFLGLELPEWRLHKEYPDECAFAIDQPRVGYSPYVKIGEDFRVVDFRFFPTGHQPDGWKSGFARSFWARSNGNAGAFLPPEWKRYRLEANFRLEVNDVSQNAYFPKGGAPKHWIIAEIYEENLRKFNEGRNNLAKLAQSFVDDLKERIENIDDDRVLENTALKYFEGMDKRLTKIDILMQIAIADFGGSRARILKNAVENEFSKRMSLGQLKPVGVGQVKQLADDGYSVEGGTPIEHISSMLTLAKQKHHEAISMFGKPDAAAIPRLHEVLKLLEEVEILADDAGSYVDSTDMKAAIKELHSQQASVKLAIARLEQIRTASPWSTPWPWITLALIVMALTQVV